MEAAAGIHDDWELLIVPDTSSGGGVEPSEAAEAAAESTDANDGAMKSDYFALDSDGPHREAAFGSDSFVNDEVRAYPDIPGSLNQGTDTRYLSAPEGEPGFSGNELSRLESGEFRSRGSLDGHQNSRLGSGSEKGFWSDEAPDDQRSCIGIEELGEGNWDVAGGDVEEVKHGVANGSGQIAVGCKSLNFSSGVGDKMTLPPPGEKRGVGMAWWKLPIQICAFRVKPIWPISMAAAMLGMWMLGKRLCWIKKKRRNIRLKLILDEKKTSQLKVNAARLNEAFSVVKRAPIIRAQLPSCGFPLPVLGFQ